MVPDEPFTKPLDGESPHWWIEISLGQMDPKNVTAKDLFYAKRVVVHGLFVMTDDRENNTHVCALNSTKHVA